MDRKRTVIGLTGFIAVGLLLSLIGGTAYAVRAQSAGIVVVIARPGEGETIYAGPQTLLYSVAVTGRVVVASGNPQGIQVRLDILDGAKRVGSRTSLTSADGTFSIPVTVNPDRSASELLSGSTLDRNGFCLSACHYGTDLSFTPGHLLLRVTATDAGGRQTVDQRHVIVDRGGYATIPVQVELDPPAEAIANIPITIGTRVYMVRARYAKSTTDASGRAQVTVEALAEAPTHYVIQVEPTVVNGLLIQSVKPVEVDLPPGAASAPLATLKIIARSGQITGHVTGANVPMLTVRAIQVRDGASYQAITTAQGQFAFPQLPIDQYLLALDRSALAPQNLTSRDLSIDLSKSITTNADIPLSPLEGASLRGTVRDSQGTPLPFGWFSVAGVAAAGRVLPGSSVFFMTGLPPDASSLIVTAPGYYSHAQAVDLHSKTAQPLDLALVRRPETRSLPWGSGEVIIPPESSVTVTNGQLTFTQGWLWGQGGQPQSPLEIQVDSTAIQIVHGQFALERVPGQTGWFYLLDGEAAVVQGTTAIPVKAGEMVALNLSTPPLAVPLDPVVIAALRPATAAPVSPVWEPTLGARVRDGLAQMGIAVVQVVTLATYLLDVLLVGAIPLAGLIWWLNRRTRGRSRGA